MKLPLSRSGRPLERKTLAWLVGGLFALLALPSVVLVYHAHRQLENDTFMRHRMQAEQLTQRINTELMTLIDTEEARSFADYSFLVVAGDRKVNMLQRSPLSNLPGNQSPVGLVSYFQIDAGGTFSTPLLPSGRLDSLAAGVPESEFEDRLARQQQALEVLRTAERPQPATATTMPTDSMETTDNLALEEAVSATGGMQASEPPAAAMERTSAGAMFSSLRSNAPSYDAPPQRDGLLDAIDRPSAERRELDLEQIEDLQYDSRYAARELAPNDFAKVTSEAPAPQPNSIQLKRAKRVEQVLAPAAPAAAASRARADADAETDASGLDDALQAHVAMFESELDPFQAELLDADHLVLFRNVWRDNQRYIQGAVIEKAPFLSRLIEAPFRTTNLAATSDLVIGFDGNVVGRVGSNPRAAKLLYRNTLDTPFEQLELIFSFEQLATGSASMTVTWASIILAAVLVLGLTLIYRIGAAQIDLNAQQRDFVSAVSHELKTPLTSIRMYGEMLKAGWVDEAKKRSYYQYIFDESERLTRLINNVLQLARLSREHNTVNPEETTLRELADVLESKITSVVASTKFELRFRQDDDVMDSRLCVDVDAVSQVLINLVDNALKFSRDAEQKAIDIAYRRAGDRTVAITVRDFGPGIPKEQIGKIFRLFYRMENELTRETVGTGIGLALVHQLVTAMGGRVDVANRDPGAEFKIVLPATTNPG